MQGFYQLTAFARRAFSSRVLNANSLINPAGINLLVAWTWIALGFASGLALGMKFHQPDWLGGYASLKRRLYRLAHISFFGLGAVNLMFYLTTKGLAASTSVTVASAAFVAGAVAMPLCCVLMAHRPALRLLFAVPVISLLVGAGLTISEILFNQTAAGTWNLGLAFTTQFNQP